MTWRTEAIKEASKRDSVDPIGAARADFQLPEDLIYLDGNSLGALPKAVRAALVNEVDEGWGQGLIGSWNHRNWIDLPIRVGDKIGRVIGAAKGQVLCADNLSTNLFKLLAAVLLTSDRRVILSEDGNFPTDNYIVQGLEKLLGKNRCELRLLSREALYDADFSDVAVVALTHVNFKTGAKHDMAALTERAQAQGALALWDLAHSAGAVELDLDADNVDLAVGCSYKFLNGGPGAPGFLYVNKRHQPALSSPIAGWMGHANLFAFEGEYRPAEGVGRFLSGTQNVLGLKAVEAALSLYGNFSMRQLAAKSEALSELFLRTLAETSNGSILRFVSPQDPSARGSQLSFAHSDGYAIAQALIADRIIVDFRAPDILRFGFAPLYNSYHDVVEAVARLERILTEQIYLSPQYQVRHKVT